MKRVAKKRFIYDSIVDGENICNLEKERKMLVKGVAANEKLLVYGRRNTGKTSLVKNVVAVSWLSADPKGFYIYVDLYGVRTMEHILARLNSAFVDAFKKTFRTKTIFIQMLDVIKSIRPQVNFSSDGEMTFGITLDRPESSTNFHNIFEQINNIASSGYPVLIVMDEFQDIGSIVEAEGILRDCLQNLNDTIPIIIMGSKKHLLSRIFAVPKAPLYNWGNAVEFGVIDYDVYTEYMNERFKQDGLSIDRETSKYLQDLMHRDPEQINRLCDRLLNMSTPKNEIKTADVDKILDELIEARRSVAEECLTYFNASEEKVLTEFSKLGGVVRHPMGKEFLKNTGLSLGGVKKTLTKLENEAIIYKEENAYFLADPMLKYHLLNYRP